MSTPPENTAVTPRSSSSDSPPRSQEIHVSSGESSHYLPHQASGPYAHLPTSPHSPGSSPPHSQHMPTHDQAVYAPIFTSDPSGSVPSSGSNGRRAVSSYVPSRLNPNNSQPPGLSPTGPGHQLFGSGSARSRPASRASSMYLSRLATEESQWNNGMEFGHGGQRGSMILYRYAGEEALMQQSNSAHGLAAPKDNRFNNRFSTISSSGSISSLAGESKYPAQGNPNSPNPPVGVTGVFLPYAYDPDSDQNAPPDPDDLLHEPDPPGYKERVSLGPQGFLNVFVLIVVIFALLTLFTAYPIITFFSRPEFQPVVDNTVRDEIGQIPGP